MKNKMLEDYLLKMWNPFYRMRAFFDMCFGGETTMTAMDFISWATDPNEMPKTNFTEEQLSAGKLVFNDKNKCWCLERPTKGKIMAGWFYPNEGQSVKYKIAV